MAVYFAEKPTVPEFADGACVPPAATSRPHKPISIDRDRGQWPVDVAQLDLERLE